MSISLKALYDQVQNIKSSNLSIVSETKTNGQGYVEFSNGLIINWGATGVGWRGTVTFPKSYKSFVRLGIAQIYGWNADQDYATICNITNKGFRTNAAHPETSFHWIAIGY